MTDHRPSVKFTRLAACLAIALFAMAANVSLAQNQDGQEKKERPRTRASEVGAESIKYETSDGVFLRAMFYKAAPRQDKNEEPVKPEETPVVLLVHKRGGSQQDWIPFAKYLQTQGFAVLTFDFRGHGESIYVSEYYLHPKEAREREKKMKEHDKRGERVVTPGSREKRLEEEEGVGKRHKPKPKKVIEQIDQKSEFKNAQEFMEFAVKDLEAMKRKLIEKNNASQLNVRNLGIVSSEDACMLTLRWLADYEFVDTHRKGQAGWNRQGGDVNAIVLISPPLSYFGTKATPYLSKINPRVPICVVTNNQKNELVDGGKIADVLKVPLKVTDENSKEAKSVAARVSDKSRPDSVWLKINSDLTGMALINPPVEKVDEDINGFLYHRLFDTVGVRGWEKRTTDIDKSGFGSERDK